MTQETIGYGIGLAETQRERAAQIYDEAFGAKFSLAIKSRRVREDVLRRAFVGKFGVTASAGQVLVGLAGFHTPAGSFTGGIGAGRLLARLGVFRGLWAIAVFGLYARTPAPGELVMDGIAVHEDYRGQGIGSRLLHEIVNYARGNGFKTVRLDVIDINPGARRLYERRGFVAVRTEHFPWLRWLLGFGGSTTMEFRIDDAT